MTYYLYGPLSERQDDILHSLMLRGYRVRSRKDLLNPDDPFNCGTAPTLAQLPAMQLREMLEASAVIITEECGSGDVLQLIYAARFGSIRVVHVADLPFFDGDCTDEHLDTLDIVQPPRAMPGRARIALRQVRASLDGIARRINDHLGEHLKNPMTRTTRAEHPG